MDTLFGLPAHTLLIHAPIVLLPLAAVATVVLAVRPGWRRSVGWWPVVGSAVLTVLVFLAKSSGEAFDEALAGAVDVGTHEQLGNTTFVLTLIWLGVTAVVVALDQTAVGVTAGPGLLAQSPAVLAVSAAWVLVAALATIWLIRTGHEGARLVWEPTMDVLDF
jgi:hypothetical protein